MSAVFTPTRAKISLERFHKMAEAGIFGEDDRIELIVFRGPGPSGYAQRRAIGPKESVELQALAGVSVEWDRVFA
jgi:hypothetical protein